MTVHNHNATSRRTEAQQAVLNAARAIRQEQVREQVAALIEDIRWLIEAGETNPDVLASRVGYEKRTSLARRLYRHGLHELAHIFDYRYDPNYSAEYRERNRERVREWNRKARHRYRYGTAA